MSLPLAHAGTPPTPIAYGALPAVINLDGTGSTPGTGGTSITEWLWAVVSDVDGATPVFDNVAIHNPQLTVDTPNNYLVFLRVKDDLGNWSLAAWQTAYTSNPPSVLKVVVYTEAGLIKPTEGQRGWHPDYQALVDYLNDLTGAPPTAHAADHADGGTDELKAEDLATASTNTAHVLKPDGTGGLAFGAVTATIPDPLVRNQFTAAVKNVTPRIEAVDVAGMVIAGTGGPIELDAALVSLKSASAITMEMVAHSVGALLLQHAGVPATFAFWPDPTAGWLKIGTPDVVTGLKFQVDVPTGDVDTVGTITVDNIDEHTAEAGVHVTDALIKRNTPAGKGYNSVSIEASNGQNRLQLEAEARLDLLATGAGSVLVAAAVGTATLQSTEAAVGVIAKTNVVLSAEGAIWFQGWVADPSPTACIQFPDTPRSRGHYVHTGLTVTYDYTDLSDSVTDTRIVGVWPALVGSDYDIVVTDIWARTLTAFSTPNITGVRLSAFRGGPQAPYVIDPGAIVAIYLDDLAVMTTGAKLGAKGTAFTVPSTGLHEVEDPIYLAFFLDATLGDTFDDLTAGSIEVHIHYTMVPKIPA